MSTILVIGRSGQLAQALRDVFCSEISSEALSMAKRDCVFLGRPEFDISNKNHIEDIFKKYSPKIIINTSAYTQVDRAELQQKEAYLINAEAVKNIAENCSLHDVILIHISTDYVFDGNSNAPYSIKDNTNPRSVYGNSKLNGENYIKKILSKHIIIRTSWMFSQYGHNFVKTMLNLAKTRESISLVNDQVGNPTSAYNLALAIRSISDFLLEDKNSLSSQSEDCFLSKAWSSLFGTYHYTDTPTTTWYEFAKTIFEIAAKLGISKIPKIIPITSLEYEKMIDKSRGYAERPMNSSLDCSLIRTNFGIDQKDWHEELTKVISLEIEQKY